MPQFAIQVIYLINTATSDQSNVVFLSLMFTIVSLLFAFESELLYICQLCSGNGKYNSLFTCESKFYCKLTLSSNKLRYHHSFGHKNISKCILNVLRGSGDKELQTWLQRSDVRLKIELFYIEQRIYTLNEMDCFFEILLLTGQVPCKQKICKIEDSIGEFEDESKENNKKLISVSDTKHDVLQYISTNFYHIES